ncbi:MAG: hypothetical protein II859_03430 [Bacteroidales bacterium]|nr:hypothetical protein [Bacteroidales bacterium]
MAALSVIIWQLYNAYLRKKKAVNIHVGGLLRGRQVMPVLSSSSGAEQSSLTLTTGFLSPVACSLPYEKLRKISEILSLKKGGVNKNFVFLQPPAKAGVF